MKKGCFQNAACTHNQDDQGTPSHALQGANWVLSLLSDSPDRSEPAKWAYNVFSRIDHQWKFYMADACEARWANLSTTTICKKKLDLPLCIKAYSFLNFFESQPTVSVKPATYSIRQSRFGFNCRSKVWTKGAFQPTSEQGLQGFQGLPDSSCSCTGSHSTSTDDSKPSGLWAFTCITYKQRPSTETTEFKI